MFTAIPAVDGFIVVVWIYERWYSGYRVHTYNALYIPELSLHCWLLLQDISVNIVFLFPAQHSLNYDSIASYIYIVVLADFSAKYTSSDTVWVVATIQHLSQLHLT